MTFAEYLYYLLPSGLKKIGKKINHFYIFCSVLGNHCQEVKDIILDVREMSMIKSCPSALLPIFGQEREMPRLNTEGVEQYRNRLMMKNEIAEKAGTTNGIIAAIKSLGYENVYIEPLYITNPSRWAEATVWISGGKIVIDDRSIIQSIINDTKPAGAKLTLAQEQVYTGNIYVATYTQISKIIDIRQV